MCSVPGDGTYLCTVPGALRECWGIGFDLGLDYVYIIDLEYHGIGCFELGVMHYNYRQRDGRNRGCIGQY